MPTLQGLSDGNEVVRTLEVEPRGTEVFLWVHPPENERAGQDILVSRTELLQAIRQGEGRVAGASPVHRTAKECEVEQCPEGLRVKIHPQSGSGSWWVVVRSADLEAALS